MEPLPTGRLPLGDEIDLLHIQAVATMVSLSFSNTLSVGLNREPDSNRTQDLTATVQATTQAIVMAESSSSSGALPVGQTRKPQSQPDPEPSSQHTKDLTAVVQAATQPTTQDITQTVPQAVAAVAFDDLPLELHIKIFRLTFIRSRVRLLHIDKDLNIITHAKLSAQLLRVSPVWQQFGGPMLLENPIEIPRAGTLFNMIKAGTTKEFPQLLQLKHLTMSFGLLLDSIRRL
jgi:hypothetical protein